jgi:FkbM family methyltransferase
MMSAIFRLYRAARYLKLTKRPSALRVLSRFPKLDLSVLEPGKDRSRIYIKGTDVEATAKHCQFLLRGSDQVRQLVREAKASLKPLPDGVLLEAGGVKLKLQSWEELFIAKEIFAEGIYNLRLQSPFALLDIGMNVGTTSLFFARNTACQAIYAFEPFPKTVEKARVNLSLNPDLAGRIHVTAKGVAARQFSTELDYVEEYKGSLGLHGLPWYVRPALASVQCEKVRVEFVACADVFAEFVQKHPVTTLVCKLDCEGAEYEILEALARAGLLSRIGYFMIEWHEKGAGPLQTVLTENGFCLLSFSPCAPTHSMIYAWRQESDGGQKTTP